MSKMCRACRGAEMHEVTTTQHLTVKGVDVEVSGLLHMECPACGATLETPDQMDINGDLVRARYLEERASFKRERGLLTGAEIRAFRARFDLTQKDAATLLGGGPVAFAKYEAEDVVQNTAMDNLIRVCLANPVNVMILAQQKGIALSEKAVSGIRNHFVDLLPAMAPKIQKFLDEEMAKKRPRVVPVGGSERKRPANVIEPQVWKRAA